MKKKIGIVTFHTSHNCGSMLQAYALQNTLEKKYFVDAELIDFRNNASRNMYGLFDLRPKRTALKNDLNTIFNLKIVLKYRKDYENFKKEYLKTSKKGYRSSKKMKHVGDQYDLLIAGGDQIWNVRCADADDAYFLCFADNVKKVAFSPSLGGFNINTATKNPDVYKKYLEDFKYLSVREPNGQKWLNALTGREDIPIIADPTLLLTHEEWVNQFDLPCIKEKFIFNYAFYHNSPEANEAILKISKKLNVPVYVLDNKSWAFYRLDKYGIKKVDITGPAAFIAMMEQAELVLTQSFHGTLFSSMFNKKFWSYKSPKQENSDDDRATAILEQLGLSDRYTVITELAEKSSDEINHSINYTETDNRIKALRENAFKYIDEFIK